MLTSRGEEQARVAGVALALLGAGFEGILFSPKTRARQTAELAAEGLSEQERAGFEVHPPLAGDFRAAEALEAISGCSADARLLLVGHEPDLTNVIAELTGAQVDLKKGGLAVVRLEGTRGELTVLMRPRELALIAGAPVGGE